MLVEEPIIFPYLKESNVLFLNVSSRDEALNKIVGELKESQLIAQDESFLSALLARESLVSTGIGLGCAIPHAKLPYIQDFFISIGIIRNGGIDWKSIDNSPVKLIFLVGGPTLEPNRYLKMLSALTEAIRSESFRREMMSCHHPKEVLKLFESI